MDGAQDYDIVMLKTDYIKSVKVIKKGKMDEIVLPSVSYHSISKKEVGDLVLYSLEEGDGTGSAFPKDSKDFSVWQLCLCLFVKAVLVLFAA